MRVCSRANCGTLLLKPDGSTDWKKRFCSTECKRLDLKEKMQGKRQRANQGNRCPMCGLKPSQGYVVSRNKARTATVVAEIGEMVKG